MIVECGNCGAPLEAEQASRFVKCRYCKHSNKVASTRTLMAVTPADWQAPSEWEAAQVNAAKKVAVGAVGMAGCVPLVLGIVGVAVAGMVVAGTTLISRRVEQVSGIPGLSTSQPAWDGSAPFSCGMNDSVRIDGVTANLPGQVAIRVSQNCQLEISNSQITAAVGIQAEGNREVRLRATTIVASEVGVRVSQNKSLVIAGGSVMAAGPAVEASGNASVTLRPGATLEGSPAVETSGNARFNNAGGEVVEK